MRQQRHNALTRNRQRGDGRQNSRRHGITTVRRARGAAVDDAQDFITHPGGAVADGNAGTNLNVQRQTRHARGVRSRQRNRICAGADIAFLQLARRENHARRRVDREQISKPAVQRIHHAIRLNNAPNTRHRRDAPHRRARHRARGNDVG